MQNAAHEQDRYQGPVECIRAARAGITAVTRSLQDLSADQAESLLEQAATQLQSAAVILRDLQQPGDKNLRLEIEQVRRQLKTLALTLSESERLVSGWIRRIGATSGYTEKGASAPLILVKKVNVTG